MALLGNIAFRGNFDYEQRNRVRREQRLNQNIDTNNEDAQDEEKTNSKEEKEANTARKGPSNRRRPSQFRE